MYTTVSQDRQRRNEKPCPCQETGASRKEAIAARMITDLGRFLSDVGELLAAEIGESREAALVDGRELPRRYELCSCRDQENRPCCGREKDKDNHYYCKTQKACENSKQVDCGCHLFRADKNKPKDPWEHRADPNQPDPDPADDTKYDYACICVRDSHRG